MRRIVSKYLKSLEQKGCIITSPQNARYNCVAYAADIDPRDQYWWPEGDEQYYWPKGIERRVRLPAFIKLFGSLGYTEPGDESFVSGMIKVAIYVDETGRPTHVARQLESGCWTSKLVEFEDIKHPTLQVLLPECGIRIAAILGRSMELPH